MTIDQLIEYFEKTGQSQPIGHGLREVQLKAAKLLRAGQAMRNCFNLTDDDDGDFWATDIKRSDLSVAGFAWDAVTREETK